MTAMKEALKKAGIISPAERLQQVALKCMIKHSTNTKNTIDAIREIVSKDLSLMNVLFALEWNSAIHALLHRVKNDIAYRSSTKKLKTEIEREAVITINKIKKEEDRLRKLEDREQKKETARYDKENADMLRKQAERWAKTPLFGLTVDKTPIWDVPARTAILHVRDNIKKWQLVEALCEGLPNDGKPISHYHTPEDAEKLWKKITGKKA